MRASRSGGTQDPSDAGPIDGVLVIDKPEGFTSHDVVAVARGALRERRIGHTGTLDPMATGVLPLACGRATRLVRFLTASDKDYDATVRFGIGTDTYDITGHRTASGDAVPDPERLEAALASLRGDYLQTPPAYSAKKVGGERAYALARQDQPVTLAPVPISVPRAELVRLEEGHGTFAVTCSAGFYVRVFAHELGKRAGTVACLSALRRTRSGEFTLEQAIGVDALRADPAAARARVIPLDRLLQRMPGVMLSDHGRDRVSHGLDVDDRHVTARIGAEEERPPSSWTRLLDGDGRLLAVAEPGTQPDALHPSIVLI